MKNGLPIQGKFLVGGEGRVLSVFLFISLKTPFRVGGLGCWVCEVGEGRRWVRCGCGGELRQGGGVEEGGGEVQRGGRAGGEEVGGGRG